MLSPDQRFTADCSVRYSVPSGEIRTGRFERYLEGSCSRAVVWFAERCDRTGVRSERPQTVNVRYLSPAPGPECPEIRRRNRRQAMDAFPLLAPLFTNRPRKRQQGARWDLTWISLCARRQIIGAVDRGEALMPLLTRMLDAKPWMLRHLARHDATFRATFQGNLRRALESIRWATPELAPDVDWELAEFDTLKDAFGALPNLTHRDNQRVFRQLLRDTRRVGQLRKFARFVRALGTWLARQRCDFRATALPGELLGVSSLREWLMLEQRWREVIDAQLSGALPGSPRAETPCTCVCWPGLFEGVVEHAGCEFTCLTDRGALIEEGRAMQNCIATYLLQALDGSAHLISVRQDGDCIATVEVCWGPKGWEVLQACGPSNDELDEKVEDAIRGFIAQLNSPASDPLRCPRPGLAAAERERLHSQRILLGLDYLAAAALGRATDHFTVLAQEWGRKGFEQYRPCLEIASGRSRLFESACQLAEELYAGPGRPTPAEPPAV